MNSCPTESELERYAAETNGSKLASSIDDHVEACTTCRRALDNLLADNALFGDLKKAVKQNLVDPDSITPTPPESNLSQSQFAQAMQSRGYHVLEEIHRGGQGVVFKAVQQATNRFVAVKQLILHGHSTSEQLQRFEREIDVIARLSHPNIVTVFDSGHVDRCPFFVMELVAGKTLNRFMQTAFSENVGLTKNRENVRSALRLHRKICSAVSYAHQLGIIHRDLKPGNILVDDSGEPRVLDFGLAKFAGEGTRLDLTQTGQFIGTLAYASPEQFRVESNLVDTRSDVYSLGVILYEMLTNQLPFSTDVEFTEIIKNILESTPESPSELCKSIDHDAETIVLKAMAKDPKRRYQTVAQLDRDIELFLDGRPIEAKRDSTFYFFRKSLQRNKSLVVAVASMSLVVLAALVVSLFFWNQAISQRDLALAANANETIAREEAEFQSYVANIVAAKSATLTFDVGEAKRRLANAPLVYHGWERDHWLSRSDVSLETFSQHRFFINDFNLFPDGKRIASVGGDMKMRVWSIDDPSDFTERVFSESALQCEINRSGSQLACVVGQSIRLLDSRSLRDVRVHKNEYPVIDLKYVSDGVDRLAFCQRNQSSGKEEVALWNFESDSVEIFNVKFERLAAIETHPAANKIAVASKRLGLLDLDTGQYTSLLDDGYYSFVCFNQSGDQMAVVQQNEVLIVESSTGKEVRRLKGHSLPVNHAEFSSDGKTMATCSSDRTVRTWDLESGKQLSQSLGHEQAVVKLEYADNASRLISASKDATLKLWNPNRVENPQRLTYHDNFVRSIDFSPDGKFIASACEDSLVAIHRVSDGKLVEVLKNQSPAFAVSFSPDGSLVAAAGDDHFVRIWDLQNRKVEKLRGHTDRVHSVRFDSQGRRLVSSSRDGTVRVWDVESLTEIRVFEGHPSCVHNAVFEVGGDRIASRCHQFVKLWDSNSGEEEFSFKQRIGPEDYSLAFHPKKFLIAAGSSVEGFGKGFVNFLNPETNRIERALEQHNAPITAFDFSQNGTRAVSSSLDAIKIWDVQRAKEVASLEALNSSVYSVKFSPDGKRIAAGLSDGTVMIWNSQSKQDLKKD